MFSDEVAVAECLWIMCGGVRWVDKVEGEQWCVEVMSRQRSSQLPTVCPASDVRLRVAGGL